MNIYQLQKSFFKDNGKKFSEKCSEGFALKMIFIMLFNHTIRNSTTFCQLFKVTSRFPEFQLNFLESNPRSLNLWRHFSRNNFSVNQSAY